MRGWWLVSYIVLWALFVALAAFCIAMLRQLGLLYVRLGGSLGALQTPAGPEVGGEIPVTEVHDRHGIVRTLIPSEGRFALLLFMSPTCELCDPMIPDIPAFARSIRTEADLMVVMSGPDDAGKLARWRAGEPPVVSEPSMGEVFGVPSYPYGVLVDDRGRVASKGLINDVIQLESLLNDAGAEHGDGHERHDDHAGSAAEEVPAAGGAHG